MPSIRRRPRRRTTTTTTTIAAVLALTLVSAAIVVLPGGSGVRAASPPVPGEIAFTRLGPPGTASPSGYDQFDLARVVAADPFTPAPDFAGMSDEVAETQPAFSRDGFRIAFARELPGTSRSAIWVADADGTQARQLTAPDDVEDWSDTEPSWSPDGTRLVFTRLQPFAEGPNPSQLWTVPVDGSEGDARPLVDDPGVRAAEPDWSPTGDLIAYRHEVDGAEGGVLSWIYTVPATGGTGTALTGGPYDAMPAWSPDGSRLAFIASLADRPVLTVREVGSGTETVLVRTQRTGEESTTEPREPAWSPDGRLIAYTWQRNVNAADIRAVPVTGGDPIDVATGPTEEREPSWRPTADLRVTLSSAPTPLRFGQPATITATVTNGGPATARSAALRLRLSADFAAVAVTPAGCVLAGAEVTCAFGDLDVGATVTVTVTGRPTTFGVVTAVAQVYSAVVDLDPSDNEARVFPGVEGTDLAVTAVDVGSPYLLGGAVTYEVSVRLVDGDSVQNAAVEVTLPDNVAFSEVNGPAGVLCAPASGPALRCTLPPLGFEGPTAVTLLVRGTAVELGERQGTARVIPPIFDIDPTNDSAVITTRVVPPGLAVAKQAPTTAVVGEEFGYDLGVRNGGELEVSGAVLVDVVPPGLEVVAVESTTASCTTAATPTIPPDGPSASPAPSAPAQPPAGAGLTVTCGLPALPAAGVETPAGTAQVRIRVRPTGPGVVTNVSCVRVTLGETPPSPPPSAEPGPAALPRSFEDCDAATTMVHAGDLAVEVLATPATVLVGSAISATVTVRNLGTAAVPAAVRLSLPAIACELPVAGGCVAATRDVALGPLDPGGSVAVAVTLFPVAAGTATVTATVLPATFDLITANDTAQASVSVRQPASVPDPVPVPLPVRPPTLAPVPPIGAPGFVTSVRGADFPPGATVRLTWTRGLTLNSRPVTVRPDGTFAVPLLVAHRDGQLGPRLVVATMAGQPPVRSTRFLVVPGTLDPPDFIIRR